MNGFSDILIEDIWNKASIVEGYLPEKWRKDFAGAWIQRDEYGRSSEYGWDICHLVPIDRGGTDDLANLLPIHWQNHHSKDKDYPVFKTAVTASQDKNINEERIWKISD